MKRAFITGVTGQDGSYLAELLLEKGYEVFGLVRMSAANNRARIENILDNPNFHILYGDMLDETSIFRAVKEANPDEIYNLAAQSHVGLSPNFSEYTTNVNALGFQRLINVIYTLNLQDKVKIYQALTSDIFGNTDEDSVKFALSIFREIKDSTDPAIFLGGSERFNSDTIFNLIYDSIEGYDPDMP